MPRSPDHALGEGLCGFDRKPFDSDLVAAGGTCLGRPAGAQGQHRQVGKALRAKVAPPDDDDTATPREAIAKTPPAKQPHQKKGGAGPAKLMLFVMCALALVTFAALWRLFERGGQAGWKSLIPIYNMYVMLQIAGKPTWWLVLMFVPLVGLFVMVSVWAAIVRRFGYKTVYVAGVLFLPFIFIPLLAFGDAKAGSLMA
jgi:hypothetical protein